MPSNKTKYKDLYTKVFDTYMINRGYQYDNINNYTKLKDCIRKCVLKLYKKEYGEKEWSDLTSYEQDYFVCVTIKDKVLSYFNEPEKSRIAVHVNDITGNSLLMATKELKKHNEQLNDLFETYDLTGLTDYDITKQYEHFCTTLKNFNSKVPIPSKDEWKRNPLRAYDYYMNYMNHPSNNTASNEAFIYYTLMTIVESLKKIGITIDTNEITHCLIQTHDWPLTDLDYIQTEIDSNSNLTEEEQKDMIKNIKLSQSCQDKLNSLDFYKYVKPSPFKP